MREMTMKQTSLACALLSMCSFVTAQDLPSEFRLLPEEHLINMGGDTEQGLYKHDEMKTIYLEFAQSNWWNLLTQGYNNGTDVAADMTIDGITYEDVGVGFKGQTSYNQTNGEEKKSFSIKTDAFVDGQTCQGYKTFNLNNCFDDPTFMREFLFLHLICNHVPAAKAAYVKLVINGENWGVYPSVQQMNGDYLKEWFMSNDGTLWRADAPAGTGGGGGGGGPQWGDGTAALNYLGADTTDYQDFYTLKSTNKVNPWEDLVNTCDVLENTTIANLPTVLPAVLDVDRTLWFLASEIAFGDDDSYVYKGKMDYYTYWEEETGRMVPLEYDGNSALITQSQSWSPFYHADNANYPLLYLILQVPEYRQRYLAHMRTIVGELLDADLTESLIDFYDTMIDAEVQLDDKKLYSYSQYTSGLTSLQDIINTRRNTINANTEVNKVGAEISTVVMSSAQGMWISPMPEEEATVTCTVTSSDGVNSVNLYYCPEAVGNFTKVNMTGTGNDFTATIPGYAMGTLIRFYVEAVESDLSLTRTYLPVGAEHDVYYYQILPQYASDTEVVINEVMASNNATAMDEQSQYEDWIELYNKGNNTIDLTDWYLTDNAQNLDKWALPEGTMLAADDYLIVWADEDSAQGPMHANFKVSASGELITLINSDGLIADQSNLEQQQTDMGFARYPNGTGDFQIQQPTFDANNNFIGVEESTASTGMMIFPNPSADKVYVKMKSAATSEMQITITDMQGRIVQQESNALRTGLYVIDAYELQAGTYVVTLSGNYTSEVAKLVVTR
ncbi:MAG: CotH kinase family protein [Flavobacteriales bacterium]